MIFLSCHSKDGENIMKTEGEKYIELLNSTDEYKRSDAACNLHKIKHPFAIEACIKTINDAADKLHLDYTPSVHCLIEIGEPALLLLTDLLVAEDEMTRLRAQRAIEGITLDIWKQEVEMPEKDIIEDWVKWWKKNNYSYDSDYSLMTESVNKLKKWILARKK